MAIVADTSFLVDYERGDPRTDHALAELAARGEGILIPTIVVAEFAAGSRSLTPKDVLSRAGEIVEFSADDAVAAGGLASQLIREGRFPGWSDAMIAGVAKSRGDLVILTRNPKDFPLSRTMTY